MIFLFFLLGLQEIIFRNLPTPPTPPQISNGPPLKWCRWQSAQVSASLREDFCDERKGAFIPETRAALACAQTVNTLFKHFCGNFVRQQSSIIQHKQLS
jgi:hypothetical protein